MKVARYVVAVLLAISPALATVRVNPTTPGFSITGMARGSDGRIVSLQNVGSFQFTLIDSSVDSDSANRFDLVANQVVPPGSSILLMYDVTAAKWRALNEPQSPEIVERFIPAVMTWASTDANHQLWNSNANKPTVGVDDVGTAQGWPRIAKYNTAADTLYFWSTQQGLPSDVDLTSPIDVYLYLKSPQELNHKSIWTVWLSCMDATDSYDNNFNAQENTGTTVDAWTDNGGQMFSTLAFVNLAKTTCESGDLMGINVRRKGTDATDTAGTVGFYGLRLRYRVKR
jgi:hypothetical protein